MIPKKKVIAYSNVDGSYHLTETLKNFSDDNDTDTLVLTFIKGRNTSENSQGAKYNLEYGRSIKDWELWAKDSQEKKCDGDCGWFLKGSQENPRLGKFEEFKKKLEQKGKKIMVSFGGAQSQENNPLAYEFYNWGDDQIKKSCEGLADFVIDSKFDGLDFNLEQITGKNAWQAVNFANKCTQIVYDKFKQNEQKTGQKKYISHSPEAAAFEARTDDTTRQTYQKGPYGQILQDMKGKIDFYNIQFYNQGEWYDYYSNYQSLFKPDTLFSKSQTTIDELFKRGIIEEEKTIIGKPIVPACAYDQLGYVDLQKLREWTIKYEKENQKKLGGFMFWAYDYCGDQKVDYKNELNKLNIQELNKINL